MENWVVYNKKADFKELARKFSIDQVTARVMVNRGLKKEEEFYSFLYGTSEDFYDPHLLADADLLTDILLEKIKNRKSIRIIGDYDIDGVMSTYILITALRRCGAMVSWQIPDRIIDGYGLNANLIRKAAEDGVDTILTCDNGIAAFEEIALAKQLGMTVLVTDHHEIPFIEEEGVRREIVSEADAVVNAHQARCPYPNKDLCGAACAWKVVCILYEKKGISQEEANRFLENVAFATVGDIMSLLGENRLLVKEGLKRIHHTRNIGMKALIAQCGIEAENVGAYHFGFVLGPCINASGRLDTANRALQLFLCEKESEAVKIANELVVLNEERKEMTREGVELAKSLYQAEGMEEDKVIILYLPRVHESIAGIIAGRIKETYGKPTFILTDGGDGYKGSGRSIEAYSMYEELCKCREYLTRFGGHPMAAGISMKKENLIPFREKMNRTTSLTEADLVPKIHIDVPMPISYATMDLAAQLELLAPFGKDNPRPLFADRNLAVSRMWVIGKNQNVLRLSLRTSDGHPANAIYFGSIPDFMDYLTDKYSKEEVVRAENGQPNRILLSVIYAPAINTFRGNSSLQFEIKYYR